MVTVGGEEACQISIRREKPKKPSRMIKVSAPKLSMAINSVEPGARTGIGTGKTIDIGQLKIESHRLATVGSAVKAAKATSRP